MKKSTIVALSVIGTIVVLTALAISFVLPPEISREQSYRLAVDALVAKLGNPEDFEVTSLEDTHQVPYPFGMGVGGTIKSDAPLIAEQTKASPIGMVDFSVDLDTERWKAGQRKYFVTNVRFEPCVCPESKAPKVAPYAYRNK